MGWTYQREESNNGFSTRIPEGKHRVRIKSAEKAQSKTGNDMIVLQFDVSGYPDNIYHYITFLADNPSMTNRMLTQFFDSFKDIPDGEFDMSKWIGKVGAASIKHEEYNGNTQAKISWFVAADKQGDLPAWKEPNGGSGTPSNTSQDIADGFMPVSEGVEIPF